MKKEYGNYQQNVCPFCSKVAVTKNSQGIPVCREHSNKKLEGIKCVCGSWLDLCDGKFGPYFRCMNCGNISFQRGLNMK